MAVKAPHPKRELRIVWATCPACYTPESCKRVRITVRVGNKTLSDHFAGVECKNCDAYEEAVLSDQDKQILFSVGLTENETDHK